MNRSKKIILLVLAVYHVMVMPSCRKECPVGKEGADCEINVIDKFTGLWQGNSSCSGSSSVLISAISGNLLAITGLIDGQVYSIEGTAEFTSIVFDSGQPLADGVILSSANAVIMPDGSVRITFSFTDNSSGSSINQTCSFNGELQTVNSAANLPTVTTAPVVSSPDTLPDGNWAGFALSGGSVISSGGSEVLKRGVCWGTQPNPTINSASRTENGGGLGSFSSQVFGLQQGVLYYIRAYATNQFGTAYGETIEFKRDCIGELCVGDFYQGGYIIELTSATTGLLIYPTDLQLAQWGCLGVSINTSDNSGASNTSLIVGQCAEPAIAAALCNNLGGGWFLPSLAEIQEPMVVAYLSGSSRYWTSTQKDAGTAWVWNAQQNSSETLSKDETAAVRPLKQF